jgi:hypothetical protein
MDADKTRARSPLFLEKDPGIKWPERRYRLESHLSREAAGTEELEA